ncbi:SMI1/KNR4 family protein [Bacillus sp. ISL-40]|uniref:SMI1/KNR4 family protein n=1 Tax=unclassified Bacillus (in: firmicutes) TaxID=185979 RepID=UPI001BEC360E|nr:MULTISPECIES: SMI1/KNR4 family protein [unclassified Bacillus (in: firmicutes)]MBT2701336.1 SMI1/KNR4 family protein [Bacillus sp. ISL-40]MBT2719720.1 SMI1/KNR4 family protein [Bacillus sp. ISL-46]MBT2742161.1 SMI1/KNR4 family protein [Bacillus sp. ISL-77]
MKIDMSTITLPLPTDDLFERKENIWRVKLPKDFVDFMKENNGGRPIAGVFKCNGFEYAIDRFLCLLKTPRENPLGMYDMDVTLTQLEDRLTDNEDLIGADILPIAVLFAGDFVCLDFRKNRENPNVVIWNHEESVELEPVTYLIADTFSEFISKVE